MHSHTVGVKKGKKKTIVVNSHHFKVSEDLHAALACLRRPSVDLTIWVDFLCINQNNSEEKNHQVNLMHKIYGQAESVISWLGEDGNDLINERSENRGEGLAQYIDVHPARCLQNLFSRKYWSRAWVVQEMRFSRPGCLRLRCGMIEKSYERVLEAAKEVCSMINTDISNLTGQSVYSPAEIPMRFSTFLPPNGGREQLSFREFLDLFLDCCCSDPRDNLFAIKHLFEDRLKGRIEIDYNEDKEVVVPRIFAKLVEETQDLYILTIRARQILSQTEWQKTFPSWCPFVGTPYKTTCIPFLKNQIAGASQRRKQISFVDRNGHLTLKTRGIVLGKVLKVHHNCLPGLFQRFQKDSDMHLASKQFSKWRKFLKFHFKRFPPMPYQPRAASPSAFAVIDGDSKVSPKKISMLEDFARRVTGRTMCIFEWKGRTKWKTVWKINSSLPKSKRVNRKKGAKGKKRAYWNIESACVTNDALEGDLICLLSGHQMTPILLRREGETYRVIGDVSARFSDHIRGHREREFLIC